MIRVLAASVSAADPLTVSGTVIVRNEGSGTQRVRLRDRHGLEIGGREVDGSRTLEIEVARVARDRLPLSVDGLDGADRPAEGEPLTIWGGAGEPGIPLPDAARCREASADCLGAQAELQNLRNEMTALCSRLSAIRSRRNGSAVVAAVSAVLFVGLLSAVAGSNEWVTCVALAAILVAFVVTVVFSTFVHHEQQRLDGAQRSLDALQERFTETANRVLAGCTRDAIWVDVNLPACAA